MVHSFLFNKTYHLKYRSQKSVNKGKEHDHIVFNKIYNVLISTIVFFS